VETSSWKTYLSRDVTSDLRTGDNLLAIGITLYGTPAANGMGPSTLSRTPMSASLYLEMMDGSTMVVASSTEWKAALDAKQNWYTPEYDDAPGNRPSCMSPGFANEHGFHGNPWQTGPVKLLRHSFTVANPITSARLYATALGAYRFQINGQRVGDQFLRRGGRFPYPRSIPGI